MNTNELLKAVKPRIAGWIHEEMGTLSFGPGGVSDHGALTGLADDDHSQYIHTTVDRTIYAQHDFAPTTSQAPFTLNANAQGQLVTGLRADELNKSVIAGSGLTTGGLLTSDVTLNVGAGTLITIGADTVGITPGTAQWQVIASGASPYTAFWSQAIADATATEGILKTDSSYRLSVEMLGVGVYPPSVPLHVDGGTEQVRVQYDSDDYFKITVDSGADVLFQTVSSGAAGSLLFYPVGDIIVDPAGNDVRPLNGYEINLGTIQDKYLTLHCAELWVETLVAQDTIATIGGRILVGPTTTLVEDIDDTQTTIYVKHNQIASGDRLLLEAGGSFEMMAATSGPSAYGSYWSYTVTRNIDGSGGNYWYAGDAVFNTGATGDGFIDIYSLAGVLQSTCYGPTIVGNVRNSATYNDWSEYWAIGNLANLYSYASTTYGVAFGPYITGTATTWVSVDATAGFRITNRASGGANTTIGQWTTDGTIYVGATADQHIRIQPTEIRFYDNTTDIGVFSGNTLRIGQYASGKAYLLVDDSEGLRMRLYTTTLFQINTSGDVTFGQVGTSQATMKWDNTTKRLQFLTGTTVKSYFDTDGKFCRIVTNSSSNMANAISFVDTSGVDQGNLRGWTYNATDNSHGLGLYVPYVGSYGGQIYIWSEGTSASNISLIAQTTYYSSRLWISGDNTAEYAKIYLDCYEVELTDIAYEGSNGGRLLVGGDARFGGEVFTYSHCHILAGLTVETDHNDITTASDGWINVENGVRVGGGNAGAPTYSFQYSGDSNTGMYRSGENWVAFATGGNYRGGFTQTGLYLHETSNANQSYGITIMNDSANDGFSIKHGSVAHGMTDIVETDTYYAINVANTTYGGFRSFGLTGSIIGQQIISLSGSSNAGRATTAQGGVILQANYKSGAGSTFMPADSNLVVIRDYTSCRFVFDKEGTLHCDATISQNAWDEHDDAQLIRALEINRPSKGLIKDQFDDWLMYNREDVERLGIATFNDDTDGSVFINLNRLTYLQNGAIWQLYKKLKKMEQALLDTGIDPASLN